MAQGSKWDMEAKLQAALAYVITANSQDASKLCGVPDRTIRDWTTQDWWDDLIAEARAAKQKELDAAWTGLIHLATQKMLERVTTGDPVVDTKTKEVKYVPVKLRDLAIATAVMSDKRALLRGQATQRIERMGLEKRLDKIGETFEGVGAKVISEDAVTEAVNES
jgi:hypothetical protein